MSTGQGRPNEAAADNRLAGSDPAAACLLFFQRSPLPRLESYMPIRDMLLPEFDMEMANTRKLLEVVPEEEFEFRPHPKSMTMGRLAGHIAELPAFLVPIMQRELLEVEGRKPFSPKSQKELLDVFDKNVKEARAQLAAASDEQLGAAWTLKFGGNTVFTLPRFATHRAMVMSHIIHHRGQLGVYLRVTEVEFPGMYGPSADDMKKQSA